MPLSTKDAVRETYRLALEQNLAEALKTQPEFDQYRAIRAEAAQRIDMEKDAFRATYHRRLEEAREVTLREHHARTLDHPRPDWAVDTPPSADKVDLLARNRVRADHDARLVAIRVDQTDHCEDLRRVCRDRMSREARERADHAREVRQERAKDAFTLTNQLSPHKAQTRGRSGPTRD